MGLLARCLLHAPRQRQSLSVSLDACTVTVIGAAVGESSRGGSLRRHKAGPVTEQFVFFCFLSVLVSFKGCCLICGPGRRGGVCKRRAPHRPVVPDNIHA